MNVLALITFAIIEIIFIAFAVLIARSGLRDATNRSFLYFLIAFAVWAAANYVSNFTTIDPALMLFLNRMLFLVSVFGLLALLAFITRVTHQKISGFSQFIIVVLVSIGAISSFLPWTVTDVFVDNAVVGIHFGVSSLAYFVSVIGLIIVILYRLSSGVRQKSGLQKTRSRVLFVSVGIAIGTILATNVLVPLLFNNFGFTLVGLFAGMFIIGGVSYGIVRHGMFDIKRAAIRSVTYSLVLLTLSALYFLMAFLISRLFDGTFVSAGQAVSGVAISLTLALVFQPIKRFFDKITDKVFYKNEYNSDTFFGTLNRTLVSTTNLKKLLERTAEEIARTLKSEQVFFFINGQTDRHFQTGTDHHVKLPMADARELRVYLETNRHIIQASQMDHVPRLRRLLLSHNIEIVMPLYQNENIIGLLCLGDHLNSVYTQRDIRLLETISDELVIAIQNALSVKEVTDLNENLHQRIDAATRELRASNAQLQKLDEAKDEFISMASHQLRTPLTSIKGYISMLMDGDVGKVSNEQKHLLQEAFISSERMVRLIGDFLNVSRLQTGKFIIDKHPLDLAKVVEQEVEGLGPNANARGLKFVYKKPKNFPLLDLDENKIQQVIMNFSDNAIYYSKENSTIKINLAVVGDFAEFTVKDTGIGVPIAEQEQLFNKFFRATNARKQRPDGTGVGLFLAKKVIDAHDGQMIFESKEGKGSTFGFRLPIRRLRV